MKKILPLLLVLVFVQKMVAQTDTIPPTLLCKQYPEIGLFLCNLSLSATDFIENLSDNSTPSNQIQVGIRKHCVGSGFPENQIQVQYSSGNDLGFQSVEIWARDLVGNTSSCISSFNMTDAGWNCKGGFVASAATLDEIGIDSVKFEIKGQNCEADTLAFEGHSTDQWSPSPVYHIWGSPLRSGYTFTVTPSKQQHPLNGVTTLDLSLISKHILNIEPLDSPYKILAADANQDGKVNTYDLILLRRLILGKIDALPNGRSWRFLPYSFEFPNPLNPFAQPFPERIEVSNTEDPMPEYFNFIGIKIGDVDFSADPD